ncbi:MAG: TIGR04348 family glycosyltransferase [Burkholderiales bacterium]|nr:TIGR04348 family glycosyltransferase [Burkholderiales bacterium]
MTQMTLVTPALADANNGNWQTARRWARLLAPAHRVDLRARWQGGDPAGALLIALHARRSAESIAAWPLDRPVLLVLTGTDLYADLPRGDAAAWASVRRADRLVVLNRLGLQALPAEQRGKASVVLQSVPARAAGPRPRSFLRAVMVGHLREEKDPRTLFAAARLLRDRGDIRIDHLGAALDPELGRQAEACARDCPSYRWLGARPHGEVRRRIATANVLVHASRLEGGAHVVIEALRSGTPVLASRMDGNFGLLGEDWPALFDVGDAAGLAAQLRRLRDEPERLSALARLAAQRAEAFTPAQEQRTLLALVNALLHR